MIVEFLERDFSGTARLIPPLTFTVESYSKHAQGGPKTATIKATGSVEAMQQLRSLLRYGVQIYNERGDLRWWGIVYSVLIEDGAWSYGWTLEGMANRVAVGYSLRGGGRETTGWAQNGESVTKYGKKELLYTVNDANSLYADSTATALVARLSDPRKQTSLADVGDTVATIECRGLWETLDWIYCTDESGAIIRGEAATGNTTPELSYVYEPENGTLDIGTSSSVYVAIPITIPGNTQSYDLVSVRSKIVKIGSPTDNFRVDLMTDGGLGRPNTVLATIELPSADIQTSHYWQEFEFAVKQAVVNNCPYWLRFRRTGSNSNTNYYRIATNTSPGYTYGLSKYHDGATYVNSSTYALFSTKFENPGLHFDLGTVASRSKIARSFSASYDFPIAILDVELELQKVGSPTDNVVAEIATSIGGAAVATATLDASLIDTSKSKQRLSFALPSAIAMPATIYLRISRSGSLDPYNFVRVYLDDDAPTDGGSLQVYNGSSWNAWSGDLVFGLTVGAETTQQIKTLAIQAGQFFTGIDIEAGSGSYVPIAASRDTTVLKRIEDLMDAGTGMLAQVTPARRLRIYPEPATTTHYITREGRMVTAMDSGVQADECPVGVLAEPRDINMNDMQVLIEEARYNADKDTATYRAKDTNNPFDIAGVTQG